MVTTSFQAYGTKKFSLRFRMYQNGEVRYISVNNLLQGQLTARHWSSKKQQFRPSAPFAEENNGILAKFKAKYDAALMDWQGSLMSFAIASRNEGVKNTNDSSVYLKNALEWVIEKSKESKHDDGTLSGTFETYTKVLKRCEEYFNAKKTNFNTVTLDSLDETIINDMVAWTKKTHHGKGQYFSTMLKAALNKIAKVGWFDIDKIKNCEWQKRIKNNTARKYYTLTDAQCDKLLKMNHNELPSGHAHFPMLYRDFCIFILYTGQSACDALSLKYSDIQTSDGVDYFVFKRRKIENKQTEECFVPINDEMRKIMKRWKHLCKDGYVLPVRSKEKIANSKVNNGDVKKFIQRCNVWLKKLGKVLGCDFNMSTYTFRHTAITRYVAAGVPITYVSSLMGTSVENIENIYYNNRGDVSSRDKVLAAMRFSK